jgi:hypothetical protein
MSLFVGVTGRRDREPGFDLVALDAEGEQILSLSGEAETLEQVLREGLPDRPVVVAIAPGLDVAATAASLGWTHTATHRGTVDWPACLSVDPRGHDTAYAARLAWLWHHRPGELTVLGDRTESYLVVATADLSAEIVVEVDPARRDEVAAAIAALPGVRTVR